MEIYAKSSLTESQMDTKLDIGCDGLEIQLLGELVNGEVGQYLLAKDVFDLQQLKDYPVSVVHSPILCHYGLADVNIENFACNDFELLSQVCYIANHFGEVQSKKVIVVIHSEFNLKNMIVVGVLPKVVNTLSYVLFKYPNIEIAIENVTPIRNALKKDLHLCNNFHFDNVELVEYLRRELHTDRIGTCLDTCHAMVSERYMQAIYEKLDGIECNGYSLDDYFQKNKNYVKLIHLADAKGCGYGKGKHGIKFTEETKDKLRSIMELYTKYGYTCPITLEVEEEDYLVCDNYRETKEILEKILPKLA